LDKTAPVAVPVYRAETLRSGHRFSGPALVDASDTTIWAPPSSLVHVTDEGSLIIQTEKVAEAARATKEVVTA
jgi:N-methylhydantoinase A/oxoprolinase/acetone carboxylase beta subunit